MFDQSLSETVKAQVAIAPVLAPQPPDLSAAQGTFDLLTAGKDDKTLSLSIGHPRKTYLTERLDGSLNEHWADLNWAAGQGAGVYFRLEPNMIMVRGRATDPIPANWTVRSSGDKSPYRRHSEAEPHLVLRFDQGYWFAIWVLDQELRRDELLRLRRRLEISYSLQRSMRDPLKATIPLPGFTAEEADGALRAPVVLYNPLRDLAGAPATLEAVVEAHPVPEGMLMSAAEKRAAARRERARGYRAKEETSRESTIRTNERLREKPSAKRLPRSQSIEITASPKTGVPKSTKRGRGRLTDFKQKYTNYPWRFATWIGEWRLSRSVRTGRDSWTGYCLWRPREGTDDRRRHVLRLGYNGERFSDGEGIRALRRMSATLYDQALSEIQRKH